MSYSVAICLVDLAYGGPEEGGWHYQAGQPSEDHLIYLRGFNNEDAAYDYCRNLNRLICPALNEDRPEISASNSIGRYVADVFDGFPKAYPETKPRYS